MKKENQIAIFNFLKEQEGAFLKNNSEAEGYLPFISFIWDIENMPSTDLRFKTAREDIIQHTIHNDDWSLDELFIEKLNLFSDDKVFIKFVETSVYPLFCESVQVIEDFVNRINPILEDEWLTFIVENQSDTESPNFRSAEPPIYKIIQFDRTQLLPSGVELNTIPFYVKKPEYGRADNINNIEGIPEEPAFILSHNDFWNDFGWMTIFYLFYTNGDSIQKIGEIKILSKDSKYSFNELQPRFTQMNSSFCSLGQSDTFYYTLKKRFPDQYRNILYALRDAAFFPSIQEDFEQLTGFSHSLLRGHDTDRVLRLIKHKIEGRDIENLYAFHYSFTPPYSESPIDIDFSFNTPEHSTDRIFAIIGENGVGKTQLMSQLPKSIAENKRELFTPEIPLFSKIIAVSYSAFDDYDIPQKNVHFNYHHCGLRKEDGEQYSKTGLINRFHNSWKKIVYLDRINRWRKVLKNFISEDILNLFILHKSSIEIDEYPDQKDSNQNMFVVDTKGFKIARSIMSSGQTILLYIITEIVGNIRPDSLILYDEPETHLHPNAISRLVNAIYELTDHFESFCLIATHSPVVIRELSSKNVFVMEREGTTGSVRRIGVESFGENISVLTDIVFGNRSVPKQYSTIIKEYVDSGKSFDDIIKILDSGRPLSLNARLHIQALINNRNAESTSL